jgi:hypothetical protein
MNLSDKEKENYVAPLYCDELKDMNTLSSVTYKSNKAIGASARDASYNSRDAGYITSVKNQYSLGTCWSFSSISAVESNALKRGLGTFDLSESHMIYSTISAAYSDEAGKFGKYNVDSFTGGKVTYAASYFFNNVGQLLENEMPYKNEEKKITLSEYKKGRNIISPSSFEVTNINEYGVCTQDEISDVLIDSIVDKITVHNDRYEWKINYISSSSEENDENNNGVFFARMIITVDEIKRYNDKKKILKKVFQKEPIVMDIYI